MNKGESAQEAIFNVLRNLLREGPEGDLYRKQAFLLAKTQLSTLSKRNGDIEKPPSKDEDPSEKQETPTAPTDPAKMDTPEPYREKQPEQKPRIARNLLDSRKILEAEMIRYILDPPVAMQEDDDQS